MENLQYIENLYKNYVENKFHKLSALLICFFMVGIFLAFLHNYVGDYYNHEWHILFVADIIIFIYWLIFKYFYPKNNKKKVGLVISLYSKSFDGVELKRKFIRELERKLDDNNIKKHFKIIEIKNHHSEYIKSKDDVEELHEKVKGHWYLYGDIKGENDGDKKIYFIDLNGCVRHNPISINVSAEFANDFSALLPKEYNIDKLFEFRECKCLADRCYLTVQYVVGTAALLSRDPFLALELHKTFLAEIEDSSHANDKNLIKIKNKLPLFLSAEYYQIAQCYFSKDWRDERIMENLLLSIKFNNINYGAWLMKGYLDFRLNKDEKSAFVSIKNAKNYANGYKEWMYSMAFLLFWQGENKYKDAYRYCQKIKDISYCWENDTLAGVEEFNLSVLKDWDIDKPQLWFWIGYLQYFKRKDYNKAYEYFNNYLNNVDSDFLKKKTETFLVDVRRKMTNEQDNSKNL